MLMKISVRIQGKMSKVPPKVTSSNKPKKPTLITGKKKIVSIDDLMRDEPLLEKPTKEKAKTDKMASNTKSKSTPQPQQNPKKRKEPPAVEEKTKPVKVDEIDDIFGGMKASKPKLPSAKATATQQTSSSSKPNDKRKPGAFTNRAPTPAPMDDDFWKDSRGNSQKRRKTEDGLPIFSEEELRIGKGGDTSLCPFDCNCCF